MKKLVDMPLTVKLVGAFLLTSALAVLLGLFAIAQLDRVHREAVEVSDGWLPRVRTAGSLATTLSRFRVFELRYVIATDRSELATYEQKQADARAAIERHAAEFGKILAGDEERKLYARFTENWRAYLVEYERAMALSKAQRTEEAMEVLRGESTRLFVDNVATLDRLVELSVAGSDTATARGAEIFAASRWQMLAGLAVVTLLGIALGWLISRAITRPLAGALGIFARLQDGHFDNRIHVHSADEVGRVLKGLDEMQSKLKAQIERDRAVAAENGRIRTALDKVSTAVMLVDTGGRVIYANEAVAGLFRRRAGDVSRALPGVDVQSLVGQPADALYRSVSHPPLATLTSAQEIEMTLGGVTLKSVASPVTDANGVRLGTAVQWFDRTEEVATEREINDVVQAALDGDLTRGIRRDGKTGFFALLADGMNRLLGTMADVVRTIQASAAEVSSGAEEISRGNANLSQRTEEQASSLEETASSMEEMTSTVRQNADNAQQADQLAATARGQAERGGAVVAKAVRAMGEINASSKKIADIIGVIDEIAFQTNLLALNAAVEAARAGEQGRGFAVVASEVRNLASRSAEAAKEIKTLIQDSVAKVDEGAKLVDQSGEVLESIVVAVKKVADIVAEISAASQEQSTGIEQVNKAVMSMDEVTQQNAALVEEAAAAAEALMDQARATTELVAKYRTADGGPPARSRVHGAQVQALGAAA